MSVGGGVAPSVLETLEFPGALERVAAHAVCTLGADRIRARSPATDAETVRAALAQVAELAARILSDDSIRAEPVADIAATLDLLAVPGSVLEGLSLTQVGGALAASPRGGGRAGAPRARRPPGGDAARGAAPQGARDASPGIARCRWQRARRGLPRTGARAAGGARDPPAPDRQARGAARSPRRPGAGSRRRRHRARGPLCRAGAQHVARPHRRDRPRRVRDGRDGVRGAARSGAARQRAARARGAGATRGDAGVARADRPAASAPRRHRGGLGDVRRVRRPLRAGALRDRGERVRAGHRHRAAQDARARGTRCWSAARSRWCRSI